MKTTGSIKCKWRVTGLDELRNDIAMALDMLCEIAAKHISEWVRDQHYEMRKYWEMWE